MLFYSGTGGYSPELYKAIGEKYMPITAAALPMGGYEPLWYMRHVHMSPGEDPFVETDYSFIMIEPRLVPL